MPTKKKQPPPPIDPHRRAVAAVQDMFRLCPMETATWICSRIRPITILEASYLEQLPRGPAYAVPAPKPKPKPKRPPTPEEVVKRVVTDAIERDAASSKGRLKVVQLDFDEARRQVMVKGGCEVELMLRAQLKRGKPIQMLLGVGLPGPSDDGSEMHWHMLQKLTWHLFAYKKLVIERQRGRKDWRTNFDMVLLYLWPGTGLKDVQENCSVMPTAFKMPGLLGELIERTADREAERERIRKLNKERLEFHQQLDRERRAAALLRFQRTGDAGITEKELAALIPPIDLDGDRITMRLSYPIIRLWENPTSELIEELPPECVGLALFGQRPRSVTAEDVLQQCAWSLRRALRGAEPDRVQRATAALSAVAAVHLDPAVLKRTLAVMKL